MNRFICFIEYADINRAVIAVEIIGNAQFIILADEFMLLILWKIVAW